jgi:hypothetical protein
MCGDRRVAWTDVRDTVSVILQHASYLQQNEHPLRQQAQTLINRFINAYEPFANLDYAMLMYHRKIRLDERPELLAMMECIRPTKCKDPRDKLYSALGMSACGLGIQVDYTLSVDEIYTNLACLSISRSQNLNILSYCSSNSGLVKVPSWVPDWTVPVKRESLGIPQCGIRGLGFPQQEPLYPLSTRLNLDVRFESNGKILVLRASPLDEIVFVSRDDGKDDDGTPGDYVRWLRQWAELDFEKRDIFEWIRRDGWEYDATSQMDQFNQPTYLPTNEPLLEAYFRTLCANVLFDHQSRTEVQIPRNPDSFATLDMSMDAFAFRSADRKLAVSTNGILILAPSATETEDIFTLIPGSEVPLILRKVDGNYRLIGQCYAHGFMGSEVWDLIPMEHEDQISEIRII